MFEFTHYEIERLAAKFKFYTVSGLPLFLYRVDANRFIREFLKVRFPSFYYESKKTLDEDGFEVFTVYVCNPFRMQINEEKEIPDET